jgi:hypothetical protein
MKKVLFQSIATVFFLALSAAPSFSQAALIALIFGDKVASEKFHLSVDLGMNISSLPGIEPQQHNRGLYFGLGTFIKLDDKWTLNPEFKPLSPRGARSISPLNDYSSVLSDVTYDVDLNYIDVPVLLQYRINEKFFASAGPQISFLTSATQVASGNLPLGNVVDIEESVKSSFKPIHISIPVELGYSLSDARKGKGMNIKFRYNIGVSQVIASSSVGKSSGSTFQIFASFPFIKVEQ